MIVYDENSDMSFFDTALACRFSLMKPTIDPRDLMCVHVRTCVRAYVRTCLTIYIVHDFQELYASFLQFFCKVDNIQVKN